MIEIKSKHTFILTIDEKTAQAARGDDAIFGKLRVLLAMNGMTFENGRIVKSGIYFKRAIES